jgi:hypothetical protein
VTRVKLCKLVVEVRKVGASPKGAVNRFPNATEAEKNKLPILPPPPTREDLQLKRRVPKMRLVVDAGPGGRGRGTVGRDGLLEHLVPTNLKTAIAVLKTEHLRRCLQQGFCAGLLQFCVKKVTDPSPELMTQVDPAARPASERPAVLRALCMSLYLPSRYFRYLFAGAGFGLVSHQHQEPACPPQSSPCGETHATLSACRSQSGWPTETCTLNLKT